MNLINCHSIDLTIIAIARMIRIIYFFDALEAEH